MRLLIKAALLPLIFLCGCDKAADVTQVNTLDITNITSHSATVKGDIASEGALPILSRGFCWSEAPAPALHKITSASVADTDGAGAFSWDITKLNAGKTYYVRAFYSTRKDTVYGNQLEFNTQDYILFNPDITYGTVADVDGNVYKTVTIGTQTWMAENLRTTHYQNGDPIRNEQDPYKWQGFNTSEGVYCYFKNEAAKAPIYGAYYNWYAAADTRNVAPAGWHVATEEDWEKLKEHCSLTYGQNYGYALREPTTAHWNSDDWFSFNETGFTALGADRAFTTSDYNWARGNQGYFWTKSGSADLPKYASVDKEVGAFPDQPGKGFNIRCVKD